MDFIKEKIRTNCEILQRYSEVSNKKLEFEIIKCDEYKKTNIPPDKKAGWRRYENGEIIQGVDEHYWIHTTLSSEKKENGKELRLSLLTGKEGQWDATTPQFTVYLNGHTVQAVDVNHTWLPLDYDKDYDIYIYVYTGMKNESFTINLSLITVDLKIEKLYYDIKVPYLCICEYNTESFDYVKIRDILDKTLMKLDFRDVYSDNFYKSINEATEYLKEELYEKECGKSQTVVSCIGHTHIDVAWLWTVAQTREKAQRSFSTVINMMERYKDYIFMSSQPVLYQFVRENDPELYEKIKEKIKEGRWEAEGAMWLEADMNLISGESMVRQILYGKRFMKEEFGVENKILWLPDVFGYSAALPQIMKKSGITQFFTTKLDWNEYNRMPNDTFLWKGIDGSCVFASFIKAYTSDLDPKRLIETRDEYKNKSFSDDMFMTFGWADGGGGPSYNMLENYERLKYGLPGLPKAQMKKSGEFFDSLEEKFFTKTKELGYTPKWDGELYLEVHRGTYTTMAKNKKNNRKSENLYQKAEALAAFDMVLFKGEYPSNQIKDNYLKILLNQFHDIIPGSSIKEVYDVTDSEYDVILSNGENIVSEKKNNIKNNINTLGGIFVYNSTPFEISDVITVEEKNYYAQNIPAYGYKVIPLIEEKSTIKVTDRIIENDVIRVEFNKKYHLSSVYDKIEEREILSEDGNILEMYEDIPYARDAWEISEYYRQKKWIADDVASVTLLTNGIRIERNFNKSKIYQDIVIKPHSKRIDFITNIDWKEEHILLKTAFPVDIRNTEAIYDIQFGNIKRPTHKNTSWDAAKFEVSAIKWADLSESGYGVSLMNDCKYGYSVDENVMRLSLLKSSTYPNSEADKGLHQFTYSLYPHKGDFYEGNTLTEGYLQNQPITFEKISAQKGVLPETFSLVSSDKENVVIETVKKAEDDNSVIVRIYEAYNSKTSATITTGFDFKEVYMCDLMEKDCMKLKNSGRKVEVSVKNFEILTLKFVI